MSITCLAGFGVLLLSGCVRDADPAPRPPPDAFDILVEPGQLSLQAGGSASVAAQVNDSAGQPIGGAPLKFEAEDATLLRVSERGWVESTGRVVARTFVIVTSGTRTRKVPVAIRPGPLERLEKVAGDEQSLAAGATPEALQVRATDAWGNPVADSRLLLSAESGGEAVSQATSAEGLASFKLLPPERAGQARFTIQPADLTRPSQTFTLHVTAGKPARLLAERSADLIPDAYGFKLRVLDRFDNGVVGAEVRVSEPANIVGSASPTSGEEGEVSLAVGFAPGLRTTPKTVKFALLDDESVTATAPLAAGDGKR